LYVGKLQPLRYPREGRKEEKEEEEAQAAAIAAGLQKPGPRAPPASNGTAKQIRVITW